MIGAAIKALIENHEAWVRSQPGRKKGFDLKLEDVKNAGGQIFEMDMPYTSSDCPKNFTVFRPTPEDNQGNIIINSDVIADLEDNDDELIALVDEFDAVE